MQAVMETIFDLVYLTLVITVGIRMIRKSRGEKQYAMFGAMAVILGVLTFLRKPLERRREAGD